MLITRQLVPSSAAHIASPLLLEDGSCVLLSAMASSLHVQQPVWCTDDDGKERCVFVPREDELHIGSVAAAILPCAHQCFVVLTQDYEFLVARYQANLPTPPNSWLQDDVLHHNNAWIILHRGKLFVSQAGCLPRLLYVCTVNGTVAQFSILRGVRHTIVIDIPKGVPSEFFQEKWVFNVPHSVGQFSCGVAPFRRDVVEQSDEELLVHCTVAELAKRKRLERPPFNSQSSGSSPVRVKLVLCSADDRILSMAPMPHISSRESESFVIIFAHRSSLCVHDAISPSSHGKILRNILVTGSPYFVLTIPNRVLVLSLLGDVHVLSSLGVYATLPASGMAMVNNYGTMRVARGSLYPFAGVVLQPTDGDVEEEVLWMLLENGLLTEVSIKCLRSCDGIPTMCDAPNIQSGDCEDGEWPISYISGLPSGFHAASLLPFQCDQVKNFQSHPVTERYALLSDTVSDTYVIDLVERCVVGGLLSNGAMTSACTGPDMDIIVTYAKGMLKRLSPGVVSPKRVRASLGGIHQMYPLFHMKLLLQSERLIFHFLVTTTTSTIILRGSTEFIEEVHEMNKFVLNEPTLAIHSPASPDEEERANLFFSSASLPFAQCTPTCLNLTGRRVFLRDLLPGVNQVSHACFAGGEFLAVADCQRMAILSISDKNSPCILQQECLPADVSHLTSWVNKGTSQWSIAACLWSHEILVWRVGEGDKPCDVFPITSVVLSSFPLRGDSNMSGVGLTFMNRTAAVLLVAGHGGTEEGAAASFTLTAMEDVDGGDFHADFLLPVMSLGGGSAAKPHFDLMSVHDHRVEMVTMGSTAMVEEQLSLVLTAVPWNSEESSMRVDTSTNNSSSINSRSNNNKKDKDDSVGGNTVDMRPIALRCGFVLYFCEASFYVLVLSDEFGITVSTLPELIPPEATCSKTTRCRRRGALYRGPVKYQETHALQLPFITTYDHRLTKALYLLSSNTIVTLTDRGEHISLVSAIDADTFCVIDGLPMAAREIPVCLESLSTSMGRDAVVVGTTVQSDGFAQDPTSGRLLVLHVKPLRISAVASINTSGAIDISVQGLGDDHLIAVASMDQVLVYSLTGLTLSLICSAQTKSACTTVALCYPFLSCGLYAWGTQYMKLLPEGRMDGDTKKWMETASINQENHKEDGNGQSSSNTCGGDSRFLVFQQSSIASWERQRGARFILKTCALEPTAHAWVHSQTVYSGRFVRVDGARNVMMFTFTDAQEPVTAETPDTRVVGLEGGSGSAIANCVRLPSRPLRVEACGRARAAWRHKSPPSAVWCGCPSALSPVGPLLLLPSADGGLRCAAEVPHAFAGPLLRLEQRVTELRDTTLGLALRSGAGGLQRIHHAVSFEAEAAVQCASRVLRKQSFVCVDAIEEYFLLTRLSETPDMTLSAEEREWAVRKKRLMDTHLKHVWEEYAGELQDMDVCDVLHIW